MLKQIRYFQSVVKLGSFTAAAEEHYISQSAISQQIKALEDELGVALLERKKRSFTLTPAGEYFYKKSLVLVADYDNIVRDLQNISKGSGELLRVGLLKGYSGKEFNSAVSEFTVKFPDVTVEVTHGNHDALYALLRSGEIDIVLNDQRRAFSDEYIN
ncbi:MAG: LysR family transcriptional regulator, partial [Ruminococcus sp.]|nr:LysR family transcriptional regulator [Ruminococcus sp.]